jgi:dTDP-4-dehydrorhamnose reductase
MKILICGGTGQLGSDCTHVLKKKHEVIALSSSQLDITNPVEVKEMMRNVSPSIILNCAAYTRVDACETEREAAWKVNVEGPKNLASVVRENVGRLIHISTDYVFDGKKILPDPYVEDDKTDPLSYYGKTKLESEEVVKRITDRHIILRTAWLYGINGNNFLKTMLKLALQNPEREIKVVNDQFGSPTWSYRLALQIDKLIEAGCRGTYHATSEGYCTWYELATYFLGEMGVPHSIVPCTTEEYPTPASRPTNSIMENRHLKKKSIDIMPHWKDDLEQFVYTHKERLVRETKEVK